MRRFSVLLLLLCLTGCQGLAQWDRIGAGVRFKTVGWLESVAGVELDLWVGAEKVPVKGGENGFEEYPKWFQESWLHSQLGFDSEP